jgi:Z1 domain
MTELIDPTERKKAMTRLEQLVTVYMQDDRLDEAELLDKLRAFNTLERSPLSEADLQTVSRRLAEQLAIDVDLGSVITSRDYEPWLEGRRQDIEWGRWIAYKNLLIKQGRAFAVIDKTDELTDKILDLVGDPTKPGSWKRRGLVLGAVQSGKTATYLALFNKAADAGYRLFILLAGNTEVLRQQTQARVDEAFIGRDSSTQGWHKGTKAAPRKHIGVGLIRKDLAQAAGMTTVLWDFRRSSYEAANIPIQTNAQHPYVFVVKKNKHVLEAMKRWLDEQAEASGGMLSVPVMMLDDESDFASINTKEEDNPTAINQAIRGVLGLFSRSSYVAFTATPFANIFIDHGIENDLFPRDFVYSLEAPTNYVGSAQTFGTTEAVKTEGITELQDVDKFIPFGHKSSLQVTGIPVSLQDAADTFLISNAIRDLRADIDKPRSMLVNVSRYKAVQRQVFELLSEEVAKTKAAVELHYADPETQHSTIMRLQQRFEKEYSAAGQTWTAVLQQLPRSISDVRVKLFNSDTDKRLVDEEEQWDRPARLIAVGGDVLSRGLTLDGLCVSYFYRRVAASDTLMQMGRWFGYRDGYKDLCRIWINAESADNYRFTADSIEELRSDLRRMLRQKLTPEDFGLAVKKHPGTLLITARNKMKNTEQVQRTIGLIGRSLETTRLLPDHAQNRENLNWLIDTIESDGPDKPLRNGWHRWTSVDNGIIADFLARYGQWAPPSDLIFSGDTLSDWVRKAKAGKFARWDVVVAKGRPDSGVIELGTKRDVSLPAPQRELRRYGAFLQVSGRRLRLAGRSDLANTIDQETRIKVERLYREQNEDKDAPETIYYQYLERPLVIVYPIISSPNSSSEASQNLEKIGQDDFLVALKVAIPGDSTRVHDNAGDVAYVINTVAQEAWLTEFTGSDDEEVDG